MLSALLSTNLKVCRRIVFNLYHNLLEIFALASLGDVTRGRIIRIKIAPWSRHRLMSAVTF